MITGDHRPTIRLTELSDFIEKLDRRDIDIKYKHNEKHKRDKVLNYRKLKKKLSDEKHESVLLTDAGKSMHPGYIMEFNGTEKTSYPLIELFRNLPYEDPRAWPHSNTEKYFEIDPINPKRYDDNKYTEYIAFDACREIFGKDICDNFWHTSTGTHGGDDSISVSFEFRTNNKRNRWDHLDGVIVDAIDKHQNEGGVGRKILYEAFMLINPTGQDRKLTFTDVYKQDGTEWKRPVIVHSIPQGSGTPDETGSELTSKSYFCRIVVSGSAATPNMLDYNNSWNSEYNKDFTKLSGGVETLKAKHIGGVVIKLVDGLVDLPNPKLIEFKKAGLDQDMTMNNVYDFIKEQSRKGYNQQLWESKLRHTINNHINNNLVKPTLKEYANNSNTSHSMSEFLRSYNNNYVDPYNVQLNADFF